MTQSIWPLTAVKTGSCLCTCVGYFCQVWHNSNDHMCCVYFDKLRETKSWQVCEEITCVETTTWLLVHKVIACTKKGETNLLDNQLFQGGNSWRAYTAQGLLGGRAGMLSTLKYQRPDYVLEIMTTQHSQFPVSQYIKETLQWFYRDGNSKHQLLKHPVRTGLCFWNQYLIVERHDWFWPHGLKL